VDETQPWKETAKVKGFGRRNWDPLGLLVRLRLSGGCQHQGKKDKKKTFQDEQRYKFWKVSL